LLGAGGGGFNGGLDAAPVALGPAVAKGYAGAVTDTGHKSSDGAQWALNEPDKVADWGHRANHLTALFAKELVADYYGRPATRAYFQGCSNGGRDALMEARRYPDDYDGIIAGDPAADWTGMTASFLWNYQTLFLTPGASGLATKIKLVNDAVLAKCDGLDGVKDGVLENPGECRFDPAELQCKSGDSPDCLTPAEVIALRKIHSGPGLRDGRTVFPGFPVGGEAIPDNRNGWIDRSKNGIFVLGAEFYRWMVYGDPNWAPERFQLDQDYPMAKARLGPIVDANDPDLRLFSRRGGKLILYHGWYDGAVSPEATISYFEAVRRRLGASAAADHVRLFMAPGMAHCGFGPGANAFDMLTPLDQWVTHGVAPERIIATKYDDDFSAFKGLPAKPLKTHPLCAWPKTAHYDGAGSTDDAASFTCRAPAKSS
jgi:feruloyl esterase